MRLDFLSPDDPRWQAFLERVPHDFYHLPRYTRLAATHDGGRPEAVLVTGEGGYFFLPYLVRGLDELPWLAREGDGLQDVASAYGYPGPLAREDAPGFLRAAVGLWVEAMRRRGTVSGFVRLHPLLPPPLGPLAEFGEITRRGATVSLDLAWGEEESWRELSHGHRQDIKKARSRGFGVWFDQGPGALRELAELYRETMARLGADDYYHFPPAYFRELETALGGRLWVGTVRDTADTALAAAAFVECAGILQYHLAGTRTSALGGAPTKLLLHEAGRWGGERGLHTLHLGGGRGAAEDSLFAFKAGFSHRRHDFFTWELVFLKDAYRTLEARRRASAPPDMRPGFFPAYRA